MQYLDIHDAGEYTASVQHALRSIDAGPGDVADHVLALAQLAAGRFEHIRNLVQTAAGATGTASSTVPLIIARYVAWTGDLGTAAAVWQYVRSAADSLFAAPTSTRAGPDTWLRTMTATELQRAATDLGDVMFAASLHRLAVAVPAGDVGYVTSTHDDVRNDSSARDVLDFVHGMLGIEPDATRHRIRIRPRLDQLTSFDVRQIRFGDGDLRVRAAVIPITNGRRYTIEVAQDSGAIPVTAVLEPVVAAGVMRTLVDGEPADLACRPIDERAVIVPVQLVLDEVRGLQIDVVP